MPRWREIAEDLQHQIVEEKKYRIGNQLPTLDQLMESYRVPSLNTIRRAQQELRRRGLVVTRQGVGVFVVSTDVQDPIDVLAELRALRSTVDRLIHRLETGDVNPSREAEH